MRKKLFLMCGLPGSGKTSYIKNIIMSDIDLTLHHVSRDDIRFSLVKEDEPYFLKEDEVFNKFCKEIQSCLDSPVYDGVFADATHLTAKSRAKTLKQLNLENVDIIPVFLNVSLETSLKRNAQRDGRRLVPETVIRNMSKSISTPAFGENKYEYEKIFLIDENRNTTVIRKEGC